MSTPAVPESTLRPHRAATDGGRLRRTAGWASIGMFLVWIGTSILALVWNLEQRSLLRRVQRDPLSVSLDEVRDSDARADVLNHTLFVLLIVTAACFITWMYLEYRRAERAGTVTRFETGWAIGAWFVPIWNWFRPFQVMEDVWGATAGRTRSRVLPGAWWGFSLASLVALFAATSGDEVRTIDEALQRNGWYIARAVLSLVAAVLATLMVRAVLVDRAGADVASGAASEV